MIHCFTLLINLQVTNQMITACKAYITNSGSNSIWDQPQKVVTDKIKAAIHLNQVLEFLCCIQHYHVRKCQYFHIFDGETPTMVVII